MYSRILPSLMWLVLVTMLASCGGGQQSNIDLTDGHIFDLPLFPSDDEVQDLPRESSINLMRQIGGGSAILFNGVQEAPFHMRLDPVGEDDLRYGIYRFESVSPEATVNKLDVQMSELESGGTYSFAFSNFASNSWEFVSVEAPGSLAAFDLTAEFDPAVHVSPAGNTYVGVIVFGAQADLGVVEIVTLDVDQDLGIPQNLQATDGERSDQIFISWDEVVGAEGYDVFYKLESEGDEAYALLGSTDSFNDFFEHRENSPAGDEAEYDTVYEYRVRATAGLETSAFSEPDTGFRRTAQPRIQASNRQYMDKIDISYQLGNFDSPSTVDIFRNGILVIDDAPINDFRDILADTFADQPGPLPGEHTYTMIVNGPLGPSLESEPTVGCIAEWSDFHVLSQPFTSTFFVDLDDDLDPGLPGPAFCYYLETVGGIAYTIESGDGLADVFVGQAQSDFHPSLENHAGVPWVAYCNTDSGFGQGGLFVARGSQANPTDGGHFTTYRIFDGTVLGTNVVLKEVAGKLSVLATVDTGSGTDALMYFYATVADPDEPQDWASAPITEGAHGTISTVFDFDDLNGFAAGLYLHDGESSAEPTFFAANVVSPAAPGDFDTHQVDAFVFGLGRASGADVLVEDGIMHCAYMYGETEENGRITYIMAEKELPEIEDDWRDSEVTSFFDRRVKGVALALADDGFPVVAMVNNDATWPYVYRPYVRNDRITSDPWPEVELLENDGSFTRYSADESEPRMMVHNGEVTLVYCLEHEASPLARRMYMFKLAAKQ